MVSKRVIKSCPSPPGTRWLYISSREWRLRKQKKGIENILSRKHELLLQREEESGRWKTFFLNWKFGYNSTEDYDRNLTCTGLTDMLQGSKESLKEKEIEEHYELGERKGRVALMSAVKVQLGYNHCYSTLPSPQPLVAPWRPARRSTAWTFLGAAAISVGTASSTFLLRCCQLW